MKIVDLRSDTFTKPSPEMWEMVKSLDNSRIGDDQFGEDPTVNELEEKAAKIVGKEAGLYVTSGTQGNSVSILSHAEKGDNILVEEQSHMYRNEIGSIVRIGGLNVETYPSHEGVPNLSTLDQIITRLKNNQQSPISVLCVENTHNYHGGRIISPKDLQATKSFAKKHDLKLHMDGARLFNAAIASKTPVNDFARHVDSMMFCISKGLSCPVGSLVVGTKSFITKARRFRHLLGGAMRQAGIIASFGLVALEQKWLERLEEDHENAKMLAEGLKNFNFPIKIIEPDTNIVIVECLEKIKVLKVLRLLNKEGIKAFNMDQHRIRFVTHYGINEDDIQHAIEKIGLVLKNSIKS